MQQRQINICERENKSGKTEHRTKTRKHLKNFSLNSHTNSVLPTHFRINHLTDSLWPANNEQIFFVSANLKIKLDSGYLFPIVAIIDQLKHFIQFTFPNFYYNACLEIENDIFTWRTLRKEKQTQTNLPHVLRNFNFRYHSSFWYFFLQNSRVVQSFQPKHHTIRFAIYYSIKRLSLITDN